MVGIGFQHLKHFIAGTVLISDGKQEFGHAQARLDIARVQILETAEKDRRLERAASRLPNLRQMEQRGDFPRIGAQRVLVFHLGAAVVARGEEFLGFLQAFLAGGIGFLTSGDQKTRESGE